MDGQLFTLLVAALAGIGVGAALMMAYQRRQRDLVPVAYDEVVNGLHDGVLVLDNDGAVVTANPAFERLMGCDVEAVRGQPPRTAFPALAEALAQAARTTDPIEVNLNGKHVEVWASLLQNGMGHNLGRVLLLRDVTERNRSAADLRDHANKLQTLYSRLSQLEQLKSDMMRMAAHDLRGPLGIISGYLDLMEVDADDLTEEHLGYVAEMQESVQRMFDMLEDLLSLERIEHMVDVEAMDPFDLKEEVAAAVDDYRPQAERKGQTLHLHAPPAETYAVRGDTIQIQKAITNLLNNAIKYTPDGGRIDVRLRCDEEGRVVFEVEDNGYGIPPDQQDQLFRPFFRAQTDETRAIKGTGLGLHLVKNIIERHKGSMIFHSKYQEGSTFGFRLPPAR